MYEADIKHNQKYIKKNRRPSYKILENRGDCEKVFCWRIPLYKHLRISRLEFKVHICYLKCIKRINTLRKEEACL